MAGVPILKIYRDWKDKRPERPIFRTILVSMLAVLLVEIVLMTASIWMTDADAPTAASAFVSTKFPTT